jgi:hypothetical protein
MITLITKVVNVPAITLITKVTHVLKVTMTTSITVTQRPRKNNSERTGSITRCRRLLNVYISLTEFCCSHCWSRIANEG